MFPLRSASRFALLFLASMLVACSSGDPVAGPAEVQGSISLDISGMPAGATANVKLVQGAREITAANAGTIANIPGGAWTLVASPITVNGLEYRPEPASQVVHIGAGTPISLRVSYVAVTGTLAVTIAGLPQAFTASVEITGPQGFQRTLGSTQSFTGLVPGRYRVVASRVATAVGSFVPELATLDVDVVGGAAPAAATVSYGAAPASIGVEVSGLPSGTDAAITLTNPAGGSSLVARGTRIDNGGAGRWRLDAATVQAAGFSYTPTPTTVDSTVLAGDSIRFAVRYGVSTGALAIVVAGLPDDLDGAVTVVAPSGVSRTVTRTTTLTDLAPGVYTVSAHEVSRDGLQYRASDVPRQLTVVASLSATGTTVTYAPRTATLVVSVQGAPGGAADMVRVTGPNGFDRVISATTVFNGVTPGMYTATSSDVELPYARWRAASPMQQRTVTADGRDSLGVHYAITTGSVAVAVSGLPSGVDGILRLTGPNEYSLGLTNTQTVVLLEPGTYLLQASTITFGGASYVPSPSSQQIVVTPSLIASGASVVYAVHSASLVVSITGMPSGAQHGVQVTGPAGYSRLVTGTTTLTSLAAGNYTVSASSFTHASTNYVATPATAQRTLATGGRDSVGISYSASAAPTTGQVAVTITGLPGGVNAAVTLSGNGTNRTITGSGTVSGLSPGAYTLTASSVTNGSTTYTPSPTTRQATVSAGATATASFAYSGNTTTAPTSDDLSIEHVYVTQAIQRLDNSVPLVAGRNALLRVFVVNNRGNTLRPVVRVRIYDGASLIQTETVNAPEANTRTGIAEGTLASTWNVLVPGANVRPGMRVQADVDPGSAIPDGDRSNNTWPRSGAPQQVTVNDVPAFNVRFVPVTVGALTGNVSLVNMDQYLRETRLLHPVGTVNADLRLPFMSSAPELQSNDANSGWLTVLNELDALRAVDAAPANMHYYGVVKVSYTSGIAGLGYMPGRASMGWDHLPSGDEVAAHEFGHNFGRPHTPCGVSGDASYPYAGGTIGHYGWNPTSNTIVLPNATDLMSYCNNTWTSDWTWSRVMATRSSTGFAGSANTAGTKGQGARAGEGLLVWGRIVNGRVRLEPAFRVNAPATPTPVASTYRLEALDAAGNALLDLPIATPLVDHVTTHQERQFAVIVRWTPALESSLASLRVRDVRSPLSAAVRSSVSAERAQSNAAPTLPDPAARVERTGARETLRWNGAAYPMAMVRDVATGQVVAFLRKSGDAFSSRGRPVELVLSDGVRSTVKRVAPGGQPN